MQKSKHSKTSYSNYKEFPKKVFSEVNAEGPSELPFVV